MVTEANNMMDAMKLTMTGSGAHADTIVDVNELIEEAITEFNDGVGVVVDDIEATFTGYSDTMTDVASMGTDLKEKIANKMQGALDKVDSTKLSNWKMRRLVKPVVNWSKRKLNRGLRKIKRKSFRGIKSVWKTLKKSINGDIKDMKNDMANTVDGIAAEVEQIILDDPNMTEADKEYLIDDLAGQLNDLKEMVDSEFKVDLHDEIDPKGFRKEARS